MKAATQHEVRLLVLPLNTFDITSLPYATYDVIFRLWLAMLMLLSLEL
jgi:hypothetical protein